LSITVKIFSRLPKLFLYSKRLFRYLPAIKVRQAEIIVPAIEYNKPTLNPQIIPERRVKIEHGRTKNEKITCPLMTNSGDRK
jgi:hypothetical protein